MLAFEASGLVLLLALKASALTSKGSIPGPQPYSCTNTAVLAREGLSVDHASAVAAPKSDPVFLHVKEGMTLIVTDTDGAWRMADVDTGVINWINADLVTHIVPRV